MLIVNGPFIGKPPRLWRLAVFYIGGSYTTVFRESMTAGLPSPACGWNGRAKFEDGTGPASLRLGWSRERPPAVARRSYLAIAAAYSCSALTIAEISAFTRANTPRTFTLPDQVAWVMKDQVVIGVARVDVVLDFVTLDRLITHRTRVSRGAGAGVDQPNDCYRQATFLDALLYAHSQLALRQDCLGIHTLPVPASLVLS
jgi:hypothetical protein